MTGGTKVTTSPNKHYAAALIRHFILIALFFPAFYTKYQHVYYQDLSFMTIIALMLTVHILFQCRLDFQKNKIAVPVLAGVLVLYLVTAVVNYKRYPVVFWRTEPFNILIALAFFLSLLLLRRDQDIVSDSVIRFAMGAMVVNNIAAILFRLSGGSKFYMQTFYYEYSRISETNRTFSWLYYDASEYALILLLTMGFFITYKKLFKSTYLYLAAQGVFLLCMLLTNVSTYYLAAFILFGGDILYELLKKQKHLHRYLPFTYPVAPLLFGGGIFLLTRLVESFRVKSLIWKGAWELLQGRPEGFYTGFGGLTYQVPGVDLPVVHAQNTFLNHMLRHSIGTGLAFTLLIAVILLFAFLKKPSYRSLGILLAVLMPLTLDFGLQTLHLPLVLFLIYCIFFRQGEKTNAR